MSMQGLHMTKCRLTGQPIGFNPERELCLCVTDEQCCLRTTAAQGRQSSAERERKYAIAVHDSMYIAAKANGRE
jgi:hypothetical protein